MMESKYRTATQADYALIVRLLTDGDEGVLVRSLFRTDQVPYPLISICQEPFAITPDGIEGLSIDGRPHTLRIRDNELCNVELRPENGEWYPPEMGGIILLIPQQQAQITPTILKQNMDWDPRFLPLIPSAAKVFAIAWQKKIEEMLREQGVDLTDATPVREKAFQATMESSSSLPVRDREYRYLTLHCAVMLLALYHPHGRGMGTSLKPLGWSDSTWDRYFRLLRRHGIRMRVGNGS